MTVVKFIKSFSNGQVTIPKDVRDNLGLSDDFWLKLSIDKGKIIAEPIQETKNKVAYRHDLTSIRTVIDLSPQIKGSRHELEKQISIRAL